jgi:hypothetical protein
MNERARSWARLAGRAALAVAIYHGGIVVVALFTLAASRWSVIQVPLHFAFLLAPLQVWYRRNGAADFLRVAALAFVILAALRGALAVSALRELAAAAPQSALERTVLAPLPGVIFPMVSVELVTVLALLAGLAWVNVYGPQVVPWRTVYRMLSVTAGSCVLALATIVLLSANHAFVESLTRLFVNVFDMIARAAAGAVGPEALPPRPPDSAAMVQLFWDYLFASFVFGYFLNLAGAWYVGDRIAARNRFDRGRKLARFSLPDVMVWPLIASWAVVLAGRFAKLGYLRAFALNAGLVLLALYGAQGLAIIATLMARRRAARGGQARWPLFAFLLAMLVPALTVAAMVVIPLVGVSEIWIKYRIERKDETDEGQGDT